MWANEQSSTFDVGEKPEALASLPSPLRPRLEIGAVDDPAEREADALADRVLRMPEPPMQAATVRRRCTTCEEDDQKARLRAEPGGTAPTGMTASAPPSVHRVVAGVGEALAPALRSFYEPRFDADLGGVRIHTGVDAALSARDVRAQAYTVGRHVVFGTGRYAPESGAGRELLAHELAHVVSGR